MTEGKFIKHARKRVGLTQSELSKKLGFGNPQFVSNIERGLAWLPPKSLKKFIRITKADADQIVQIKTSRYRKHLRSYL